MLNALLSEDMAEMLCIVEVPYGILSENMRGAICIIIYLVRIW